MPTPARPPHPNDAVPAPATNASVRPRSAHKLAKILAGQVDRWHGDPPIRLRAVADTHNHTTRYWVEEHQP